MSKYKGSKLGVVIDILTFTLVTVLIVGSLAFFSKGFKNWNIKEWFGITETPTTLPADVDDSAHLFASADAVTYSEGSTLRLSPLSVTATGNTLILTATVTPSNATNKAVDWSVAWTNPTSEWATGKTVTSYVTITPSSNGALTATLTKVAAFGEQVKVTCTSREDNTVKSTSTVDLRKKLGGHLLTLDAPSGADFALFSNANSPTLVVPASTTTAYTVALIESSFVGTLADTYTVTKKIFWNENIVDFFSGSPYEELVYTAWYESPTNGVLGKDVGATVTFNDALMLSLFGSSIWNTSEVYNELVTVLNTVGWQFRIQVTSTGAYSTLTTNFYFKLVSSFFSVKPTNIALNDSSYIF
jgi:hypothetical protein